MELENDGLTHTHTHTHTRSEYFTPRAHAPSINKLLSEVGMEM